MENDVTWTSDEFGTSHEGRVGVLLADGTVPKPVYFDSASGTAGRDISHWSVYDGSTHPTRPTADALRPECSCGWSGTAHPVEWDPAAERPFHESARAAAEQCEEDWDRHINAVRDTTVALPTELEVLLRSVGDAIERLSWDSPAAAIKAARSLELIAQRTAYGAAHDARDQEPAEVAAALGLTPDHAQALLARFGGWDFYG
ncbi:hypothetical protein QEZ40_000480 [Streptomyces katrae]|uniref:Uncharacterized protein n=1 Tax=Streptomyces katrae TaxID=68223 RepID=A0ABT7GRP2_9ACTN|nr:hypothetical protein [Streptomyces katrae]MDK9496138.1 hypothetical protein [Streptomyces katrae]